MVNQRQQMQQETAYSTVVNDHNYVPPSLPNVSMTPKTI